LFDSFGVEEYESSVSHIEGDACFGVFQNVLPKGKVLIGDVFNDEAGVVCRLGTAGFVLFLSMDNLHCGVPQAYAIELTAPRVVEVEVFVGIVGMFFKKYIAYEFVIMGRVYAKSVSVPPSLWSCA
jgi:hypothetical protein